MASRELFIGLMSGTSIDAVDGVLVDLTHSKPLVLGHKSTNIPAELKNEILALCQPGQDEINRAGQADIKVGKLFAETAKDLLKATNTQHNDISAIGSHGQTIRHMPNAAQPFTLQIGDPNTIAFETGITTVADFRRKDMSAGGQGAPLVPAFHQAIFGTEQKETCVLNIGGMANISHISKTGDLLAGFDTGPGNVLMDAWIQLKKDQPYDQSGDWANSGKVLKDLLSSLLDHPYFDQKPPKSTGREDFNKSWLETYLTKEYAPEDVQRTLLEFTSTTIANAIDKFCPESEDTIVCGGGAYNNALIKRLEELLPHKQVTTTEDRGFSPMHIECLAFAWLAKQTLNHLPGNAPSSTGASRACTLGGIYPP